MIPMSFRRAAAAFVAVAFLALVPLRAFAQWTQLDLPAMAGSSVPVLSHLPDGRFLYGQGGSIYLQDAWGQSNVTAFANIPSGTDPSLIAVWNASTAVAGQGGSGYSALFSFNPSNTSSTFTSIGTNYNYAGAMGDASSIFTVGASWANTTNRLVYMTLDGSINKTLIEYISIYSAGFTRDASGNLYVGSNDDGKVYKFTSSQIETAITGSALTLASGAMVHDFGGGGNLSSLAVDGLGRVWAAGWAANGIKVFDPNTSQESTFLPGPTNVNYVVSSFSKDSVDYISYLNNAGWSVGDAVSYGYAAAAAIPEPATLALVGVGLAAALLLRRRS